MYMMTILGFFHPRRSFQIRYMGRHKRCY